MGLVRLLRVCWCLGIGLFVLGIVGFFDLVFCLMVTWWFDACFAVCCCI